MDVFERCKHINDLLMSNQESEGRNELIKILDYIYNNKIPYTPLLNSLIRQTGLYPYIDTKTSYWQERFVHEAFKVNTGEKEPITLHREQSDLLKSLLVGNSIAVSAPTSFGKSFIIDAFIALRKPKNVVLIVPTIALTDETRRRLYKKFSSTYKVITTSDVPLAEKNILIFPQERAIHYANILDTIDILVIDEFYKASLAHDKERAASLQNAIMKLGSKATQKYFLAPNITTIKENPFTQDMMVVDKLNFNTVYLEIHKEYLNINDDEEKKKNKLLELTQDGKSLIYAALFKEIDKVSNFFKDEKKDLDIEVLNQFSNWLARNYTPDWVLIDLIKKGIGIHNGRLHRSLSQIQVKLFEEDKGLNNIISTSSIIEGVNTSAKKVILWSNKSGAGNSNLKNFTYKNIKGRGGRMFKHFVGDIYELVKPPEDIPTQLNLDIPDSLLSNIDNPKFIENLSEEQLEKIKNFEIEISKILGPGRYGQLQKENAFQISDSELILKIAKDIHTNQRKWNGLNYLNSENVDSWTWLLKTIVFLDPKAIRWNTNDDKQFEKFISFIQILSKNWTTSLPKLLLELKEQNILIDDFFNLEKKVCYAFSALLNDVNVLQKEILSNKKMDISSFISKVSHAFLPPVVYQLEEYGLPRMISKKINYCKVFDLENPNLTLHEILDEFRMLGKENLILHIKEYLLEFDYYILDFFFEGIAPE